MEEDYQIVYIENPEDSVWRIIGGGISTYNKQQAGEQNHRRLCYCVQSADETIVAGLLGATYWNWFYVDLLWVREDLRGHGYGGHLLDLAEQEARRRGALDAYLDTFSFQAPDFYVRRGYRVFGELPDFPTGHNRYFLTKRL